MIRAQSHNGCTNAPRTELAAYRAEIDGLRAISVIAVVAFHFFPAAVPGGFVGVDVFFVISGYLISAIILKQLACSEFRFSDFYARRARRILPGLCLVLLVCLSFGACALLPEEFARLGRHAAAAAAFVANFAFWRESGYFAPASASEPFLHLWSLGIEEQFYLLWPVALVLAWRYRLNLVRLLAGITVGSFVLNVVLTHADPVANFYFPAARFWELGLGCLLAVTRGAPGASAQARHSICRSRAARQLPLIGTALITVSAFSFDSHTPFPGFAALVPTCGAACVIAARTDSWFSTRVLANPALVFIGLISYPLYLWHWPIMSFSAILHSGVPDIATRAVGVLLSAVLAILTYRYVELPIRSRRRTAAIAALAGAATASIASGILVSSQQGFPDRFPPNVRGIEPPPKEDPLCRSSVPQNTEFNYCRRTNARRPEVVFLGDSQAEGVYEGTAAALRGSPSMLLLARGGCPPVLDVSPSPGVYPSDQRRRECNETWSAFVNYVHAVRPSVVVLVGDGSRFFGTQEDDRKSRHRDADTSARAFVDGSAELVDTLQKSSRVVYVLEIPTFESGPGCFLRPLKLPGEQCSPQISREGLARSRAGYSSSIREIQQRHPDLVVVDPIPSLCNSRTCPQISRSGQLLYSDSMHLSPTGARRFAQSSGFARFIAETTSGPRDPGGKNDAPRRGSR